jgi:hypothetical protein
MAEPKPHPHPLAFATDSHRTPCFKQGLLYGTSSAFAMAAAMILLRRPYAKMFDWVAGTWVTVSIGAYVTCRSREDRSRAMLDALLRAQTAGAIKPLETNALKKAEEGRSKD